MNTTERSTGRPTHGRWDKNTILRWYFLLSPFCTFFSCSFSSLSLSFLLSLSLSLSSSIIFFCSLSPLTPFFCPLTPFFYPLTLFRKIQRSKFTFHALLFLECTNTHSNTVQRIPAPFPLPLIPNSFLSPPLSHFLSLPFVSSLTLSFTSFRLLSHTFFRFLSSPFSYIPCLVVS